MEKSIKLSREILDTLSSVQSRHPELFNELSKLKDDVIDLRRDSYVEGVETISKIYKR